MNDDLVADSDFGDAPPPYPTTLARNGARHDSVGPILGTIRSSESDGTPSVGADADGADDGVAFEMIQVGQLGATVTITVSGAPDGARLDAWIDFNGDGNWGDASERIANGVAVHDGINVINFDVPASALPGLTFARFRLSTVGTLAVTGAAPDGEVEDYAVVISPPEATQGEFSNAKGITTSRHDTMSVFAVDLDGDGDMDVLSTSVNDNTVAWYENQGDQEFIEHMITSTAEIPSCVTAADVDGDGDMDVVTASYNDDTIAWYENDGNQEFTYHAISTTANGARSVVMADMDGDGDMDAVGASFRENKVAWYENDGNQQFTEHVITTTAWSARSVYAADVDRDGDMDVVSASYLGDSVSWFENDGSQSFHEHTISTDSRGAHSVFASDVDLDGDLDILSASLYDDTIAWFENDGSQNFIKRVISDAENGANSVFAADMDGDGDIDVLSVARYDTGFRWFENDGTQNFSVQTLGGEFGGQVGRCVVAADMDGDGDLDIVGQAVDYSVAWFENLNDIIEPNPLPYVPGAAATQVTAQLSLASVSSTHLVSATVQIIEGYQAGDVLGFVTTANGPGVSAMSVTDAANIVGSFDAATGTLTLSGAGTLADFEEALRSVTYFSSSQNAAPRLVVFQVNDGTESIEVAERTIGGYAQLTDGTVNVYGSSIHDVITVTDTGGLRILVNGVTSQFDSLQVDAINIFGYGGDDTIALQNLGGGKRVQVFGGRGNDTILAEGLIPSGMLLNGGDGDDRLLGGNGNDVLIGGLGNDSLIDSGGSDTLIGGEGDDAYVFNAAASVQFDTVIELVGGGVDLLSFADLSTAVSVNLTSDTVTAAMANRIVRVGAAGQSANLESVIGGAANDWIMGNSANNFLSGNGGNDTLIGGDGDDQLVGGDGNDLLRGGGNDDVLNGSAGRDFLKGESGADSLNGDQGSDALAGGEGDDTYVVDQATVNEIDTVLELPGEGIDTLDFSSVSTSVSVNLTSDTALATMANRIVQSGAGQSAFFENVTGGSGHDQITGNGASNVLIGGRGNDTITGNDGHDILLGGEGNDILKGIRGRNIFIGGTGADLLQGGTGDDLMVSGSTLFDDDPAILRTLLAEWTLEAAYQGRLGHLLGSVTGGANASFVLNPATVTNDLQSDYLTGGTGQDWFLASSPQDVATDTALDEVFTQIETWG